MVGWPRKIYEVHGGGMKRIWVVEFFGADSKWHVAYWVRPQPTRKEAVAVMAMADRETPYKLRFRKYVPAEGK